MSRPALRLTDHAFEQYRRRVDSTATREQVRAVMAAASFRLGATPPGRIQQGSQARYGCAGWLVTAGWACPLTVAGADGTLAIVTCMVRRRKSKINRRQWREEQREEWGA